MNVKKTVLLFFFLTVSCKDENYIYTLSDLREAKLNVVEKGDRDSYQRLAMFDYYSLDYEYFESLPYSMIAADKYNNELACFNCYRLLMGMENNLNYDAKLIKNLVKEKQDLALYYLKKGAKLGENNCRYQLIEHYQNGYGVEKDSSKADSLSRVIKTYWKTK